MNYNWRERIANHDYVIDGVLAHPYESIQMGNGDIGASINIFPHEVKITLAKSDIWDARFDGKPEQDVLTHDNLIKMMAEKNRDLLNVWDTNDEKAADYYVDRLVDMPQPHLDGPSPKRAGSISIYHPGLSNTKVQTRVSLENGILQTRFFFSKGELIVSAFAERGENRFWLHVESKGETPWFAISVEKQPDQSNPTIPAPVLCGAYGAREKSTEYSHPLPTLDEVDTTFTIEQTVPAGFDIDEFTWCMAAAFPKSSEGVDAGYIEEHVYKLRQYCALEPGKSTVLCVGIATDRDGDGDTRQRAIALSADRNKYEKVLHAHKAAWADYWDTSNIALDDSEMESVWYRNHFAFGCALSRKSRPLGSGGNVMIQDSEPWHGDIHTNHNFQKWYSTALPTNHPEWIEIYADFINNTIPLFEYQAKLIFGLEGAYCDLSYLPIMSHKYFNINNFMGRALCVTGWMSQPLWWHWQYMRDKEWLRLRGYPYIKRAAQFYYNYLGKYSNEDGEIYPSIRLEEPCWEKDFKSNRNVISDLCMFKKAFDWAIEASEILNEDDAWREKWKETRARIPAIEHGFNEDGEGWIALDKYWPEEESKKRSDMARWSRWGGGGWIVFPGEYVDGDGEDSLTLALRDMIRRTDLMNPFYSQVEKKLMYPGVPIVHPISSLLPAIRLGVKEHYESIKNVLLSHRLTYGQFSSYMLSGEDIPVEVLSFMGYIWYDWRSVENKYAGVLTITEMLIQSQSGIMRLFPFWPDGQDAKFQNLRAKGGFVVSAERTKGVLNAKIISVAGDTAQIKCETAPQVICNGKEVPVTYEKNIATFETVAGAQYDCMNFR